MDITLVNGHGNSKHTELAIFQHQDLAKRDLGYVLLVVISNPLSQLGFIT